MRTFKVAGVSRGNGKFKVRFANDMARIKVLARCGQKDIDLIELKEPMTKEAAVAFLLSIDFDNGNKEVRAALEAEQEKRSPAPKVSKVSTKTKKAAAAPSLAKISARRPAAAKAAKAVEVKTEMPEDMEQAPF